MDGAVYLYHQALLIVFIYVLGFDLLGVISFDFPCYSYFFCFFFFYYFSTRRFIGLYWIIGLYHVWILQQSIIANYHFYNISIYFLVVVYNLLAIFSLYLSTCEVFIHLYSQSRKRSEMGCLFIYEFVFILLHVILTVFFLLLSFHGFFWTWILDGYYLLRLQSRQYCLSERNFLTSINPH